MNITEENLIRLQNSLPREIDIGSLYMRDSTAHKWKAPLRSLLIRECTFWRLYDLLQQSYMLFSQGHALGARILLRSGFETLAILMYLNKITDDVLSGRMDFFKFSDRTSVLLGGSRDNSTEYRSINIVTIIEKCGSNSSVLLNIYNRLSECAHPNSEGLIDAYSNRNGHLVKFRNNCAEMYRDHLQGIQVCMSRFEIEYNLWPGRLEKLEIWLKENDIELEARKSSD